MRQMHTEDVTEVLNNIEACLMEYTDTDSLDSEGFDGHQVYIINVRPLGHDECEMVKRVLVDSGWKTVTVLESCTRFFFPQAWV